MDDVSQGGTHWECYYKNENRCYCCDSFGGSPEKFPLQQLPKPILYHKYKTQDINSNFCGSYCLNFFYLIERMTSLMVF